MTLKAALNHSDVAVTQAYLSEEEEDVVRAIRGCDFTRKPRTKPAKLVADVSSVSGRGFETATAA